VSACPGVAQRGKDHSRDPQLCHLWHRFVAYWALGPLVYINASKTMIFAAIFDQGAKQARGLFGERGCEAGKAHSSCSQACAD